MAEFTFGSGGFFADPQACTQYLAGIVIAEDHTFTQVGDCTMPVYAASEFNSNGYAIKFTSNKYHYGDPNRGWKVYLADGASFGIRFGSGAATNNGSITVEKLNFERVASSNQGTLLSITNNTAFFPIYPTLRVDKCLFKGISDFGVYITDIDWGGYTDNCDVRITGCKAWNCSRWAFYNKTAVPPAFRHKKVFENCVAYNCEVGFVGGGSIWDDRGTTFRNCVAVDCTTDFSANYLHPPYDPTTPRHLIQNCACSDNSLVYGSRVINGITAADEFQSLLDTVPHFLKLKNGALVAGASALPVKGRAPLKVQFTNSSDYVFQSRNLGDGGTIPVHTTEDIELKPIPTDEQFYSIGCHQVEVV